MEMLGRGDEVQVQRTRLRDVDVPLTAHEALRWAWPAAREHDPAARLVLITSGEDLDTAGRSRLWEFHVDLPNRRAQATLRVGEDDDADDEDGGVLLVEMVRPFVPPGDLWDLMAQGEDAVRRHVLTHWQRQLAGRLPLPLPGYDSPQAVSALRAQGVALRLGCYLGARVQVDGSPVWYLHAGDEVRITPFGPAALPAGSPGALEPPSGGPTGALPAGNEPGDPG
jgi:hypothetical protein